MPKSIKKSTTGPAPLKKPSAKLSPTTEDTKPKSVRTAKTKSTNHPRAKARAKEPKGKQAEVVTKEVPVEPLLDTSVFDEYAADIKSQDQQVSFNAIDRLGRTASPRATDLLIDCLKDPRYLVRLSAATQLGERRDPRAIEPLAEVLRDESLFVRQTAARALVNIGGREAMDAIKRAGDEGLLLDHLPEGKRLEPDDTAV